MSDEQQRKPDNGIGFLYGMCNLHATAIGVLIRRDFGAEALGMNPLIAMFCLYFIYAGTGDRAVGVYLLALVVGQLVQRIRILNMRKRGIIVHSRYAGYPYLAMWIPFVRRESTARRFVEPLMCLAVGAVICDLSVTLSLFLMFGFLSFQVRSAIESELMRKRLEQMHDAEIDQKDIGERFRNPQCED